MLPETKSEARESDMQEISQGPAERHSLLRRNLILIASYLAVLSLIAVGYAG
ncbi:MAG: hypothetical protein HRU00_07930 [Myxococcales bacterium]|nr:hypothetical protein [Myxococcales bacterium]